MDKLLKCWEETNNNNKNICIKLLLKWHDFFQDNNFFDKFTKISDGSRIDYLYNWAFLNEEETECFVHFADHNRFDKKIKQLISVVNIPKSKYWFCKTEGLIYKIRDSIFCLFYSCPVNSYIVTFEYISTNNNIEGYLVCDVHDLWPLSRFFYDIEKVPEFKKLNLKFGSNYDAFLKHADERKSILEYKKLEAVFDEIDLT